MILAYVTRFLLLRFQKFCHAFICISLNNFLNETHFSTKDMMALQVPAGVVYICLYVRPFALGLGILGILAASLQKYWLLAKAALFRWVCGCFSAKDFRHPWRIGCFFAKVLACSKSFWAKAAVSYICHGTGSIP
ncbi:hypothetical protein ACQJBY_042485 [Aegilops geniculata]